MVVGSCCGAVEVVEVFLSTAFELSALAGPEASFTSDLLRARPVTSVSLIPQHGLGQRHTGKQPWLRLEIPLYLSKLAPMHCKLEIVHLPLPTELQDSPRKAEVPILPERTKYHGVLRGVSKTTLCIEVRKVTNLHIWAPANIQEPIPALQYQGQRGNLHSRQLVCGHDVARLMCLICLIWSVLKVVDGSPPENHARPQQLPKVSDIVLRSSLNQTSRKPKIS